MSRSLLQHGRTSFDRRAWGDAFEALAGVETLDRSDLERLAWSAALSGHDQAFVDALERLHKACLEAREFKGAARAAFWLGFHLTSSGSAAATASGWLARARRLLQNESVPCAESGYLLLPEAHRYLGASDNATAQRVARQAAEIGEQCADADLVVLARNLEGRALLREGRIAAGLALLDEVMVAVTSGELSPLVTGIVYCNAIVSCQQFQALDRAREWTAALTRWCDGQQQLVTFTGHCLVHRAEHMQLSGAWVQAIEQVNRICDRATSADPDVFGDACYQRAELFRLRGDFSAAEKSYRLASDSGREPQPGLTLLRLSQGKTEAAVSSIRRVLSTTTVKWQRARLLPAYVEVMLAGGELDEADQACTELEDIAREFGTEILGAMAGYARGAVSVAKGDQQGAVGPLRQAFEVWHRSGAPYIAARIRLLLGRAYLALGDREGAELERAAARRAFTELGAAPDLAALDVADERPAGTTRIQGLSKREVEVLQLLASGKTNKVIARELFVSKRTVDRHVSNIFTKIGVASRAAATAFAYEHRLV